MRLYKFIGNPKDWKLGEIVVAVYSDFHLAGALEKTFNGYKFISMEQLKQRGVING